MPTTLFSTTSGPSIAARVFRPSGPVRSLVHRRGRPAQPKAFGAGLTGHTDVFRVEFFYLLQNLIRLAVSRQAEHLIPFERG